MVGRALGVFAAGVPLQPGDYYLESFQDSIVATASGTQATAFQINTMTSRIITVATSADSVALPMSQPGMELMVINHGANAMQVFGNYQEGATIDDVATATGVSQMANSLVIYTCVTAGAWYSEGLATGYVKGQSLQTFSYATVAANSTDSQAAGTAIKSMLNTITAAGATYAITLPVSAPGVEITIANISSQTIHVYPNAAGTTTEVINALSANASISMATATSAVFCCTVAGQWWTTPRVPS